MLNQFSFPKAHIVLICGIIVGVFSYAAINSICTGLLVINWIAAGNLKQKLNTLQTSKIFWVLISLFLLHLLGLLYTSNFEYAIKDLKIKLQDTLRKSSTSLNEYEIELDNLKTIIVALNLKVISKEDIEK